MGVPDIETLDDHVSMPSLTGMPPQASVVEGAFWLTQEFQCLH